MAHQHSTAAAVESVDLKAINLLAGGELRARSSGFAVGERRARSTRVAVVYCRLCGLTTIQNFVPFALTPA